MWPDLLPFSEVIGWILSKANAGGMIMYNVEDKGFASFTTTFIAKEYRFHISEFSMTTCWINRLTIDYVGCIRVVMEEGNWFRQRASGEYETTSLHTSYRLATLMLNMIFNRDDGIFYNIGWKPLIYHVTMEGTIFNWSYILANSLSSCITATQEGFLYWKFEFYMGSFLINSILFLNPFEKLNCSWKEGKSSHIHCIPNFMGSQVS